MKKLFALAVVIALSANMSTSALAYQDADSVYNITYMNTQNSESLSDFVRNLYTVTEKPYLDEAVYQAFEKFEQNKNKSDRLQVYSGTLEQCQDFQSYLNTNYGYTVDMTVTVYHLSSNNSYFVAFDNTLNADSRIAAYKAEAEKAKAIAASLKGATQDATINNIINWVSNNVSYDYSSVDNSTTECRYGAYSGKSVLCCGYAIAVYQLCAMNGIPATIESGYLYGTPHAFNTVTYSDAVRYVDTTPNAPAPSVTLWSDVSY